MIILQV